jgi:hypothetical protein
VSSTSAISNPAASFEAYRRRLLGLAYRMLGSMADAEVDSPCGGAHFIAPFWRGSLHYVGGLWTAPLPTAFGWYTFLVIRREIGSIRQIP